MAKLLNAKAKGSRREHKTRRYFEKEGYAFIKAGGSLGTWDLMGFRAEDGVAIQVKSNRRPRPKEYVAMRESQLPPCIRKAVVVWKDYEREPVIEWL